MSIVNILLPSMGLISSFIDHAVWRINKPYEAMLYDLQLIEKRINELYFIWSPIIP